MFGLGTVRCLNSPIYAMNYRSQYLIFTSTMFLFKYQMKFYDFTFDK